MSPQTTYTVEDIAELMKSAKDANQPYVFFTGAGCSFSAKIPLSSQLIQEICTKYPIQVKTLSEEEKNDYGKCMAKLTKDERRAIIKPHIDSAKINWAHIALACLMDEGYITRVLTFNFDNILAKACGLLGLYPATYDFTSANINLHNLIVEPAIVHLHGQSHGFTQLNSSDETDSHAKNLSEFIRTTLNHSPSLFIGYSGSADAFFTQLENKFDGQQRLIWVDYEQSPNEHVRKFLEENKGTSHHLGGQDADAFLIALAQRLGCFPPKLFQNPYEHLIDELKDVIEFPIQGNSNMDILKSTRIRLEEDSKNIIENTKPNLELLLLEGKYDSVINSVNGSKLSEDDQGYVAWAYIMQGNALSNLATQTHNEMLFMESFGKYQSAIQIKPDIYEAWNNWGSSLASLAKQTNNNEFFEQSIEKYKKAIAINPDAYHPWNNWGSCLSASANVSGDEELFKESFNKYEKAIDIEPEEYEAWVNFGNALQSLAKLNRDEKLFHKSFEKYQKAIAIKPDRYEAWNGFASSLLFLAELTKNEDLYEEAMEKSKRAEEINPGQVYNLACVLSRKNDADGCRKKLFHAKEVGTLPDKKHLISDNDLDNVRELPWFTELLEEK